MERIPSCERLWSAFATIDDKKILESDIDIIEARELGNVNYDSTGECGHISFLVLVNLIKEY